MCEGRAAYLPGPATHAAPPGEGRRVVGGRLLRPRLVLGQARATAELMEGLADLRYRGVLVIRHIAETNHKRKKTSGVNID